MARYLTESELREAGLDPRRLGLHPAGGEQAGSNRAFLLDIKEDHSEFRALLQQLAVALAAPRVGSDTLRPWTPLHLATRLAELRDALESYFALEEFYGCFELAANGDPNNAAVVGQLAEDHRRLYRQLDQIVELAEQIAYRETPPRTLAQVRAEFAEFQEQLAAHEARELELISRQSVLQIGVGD